MEDIQSQKKKANELRKSGDIAAAYPIYDELWKTTRDEYDGAGLLHCLRKTKEFDRALPLADELIKNYPYFNWVKMEAGWTYYGQLSSLDESSVDVACVLAQKILNLEPEELLHNLTIFKVLKLAKKAKEFDILTEWIDLLNPEKLSTEPRIFNRKEGWSDQCLWYYYKIFSLNHQKQYEESISISQKVLPLFPKQKRDFLRCQAYAYSKINQFDEAEQCYKELIKNPRADWWLHHAYANMILLSHTGDRMDDIIEQMSLAGIKCRKKEMGVTLFKDFGLILKQQEKYEESRDHLLLVKYIRERNEWHVDDDISNPINELDQLLGLDYRPANESEANKKCQQFWNASSKNSIREDRSKTKIRQNLQGRVSLGRPELPYCFINTSERESFFCSKLDLPKGLQDRDEVIFDGYPSFDRKKNKESWKAKNIKEIF